MSLKKVLAGVAAASFAVSALAISSFAAETTMEPITLDDTGTNMVQWDINLFGGDAINTLEIKGKFQTPAQTTGLYAGGWGVGFNVVDDWFQPADQAVTADEQTVEFTHPRQKYTVVSTVDAEGNLDVVYDFTPMGADAPVPAAGTDGIFQFGMWWCTDGTTSVNDKGETVDGSTGKFDVTDVIVNGNSLMPAAEEPEETEAPETEAPETEAPETEAPETEAPDTEAPAVTEAPADDNQVGDTEPAPGDSTGDVDDNNSGNDNGNTSVDDGNGDNPGTGVAVAVAPAVLAAGALAAAVVIRKRK